MAFLKRKDPTTPSEKAHRSLLSVIARLGACGYLIYIVVTLYKQTAAGTDAIAKPLAVILLVILAVAAAFFSVFTVIQFIRGLKNQDYSMHKYYAEDLAAQGLRMNEFGEYVPIETPADEGADEEILPPEEETEGKAPAAETDGEAEPETGSGEDGEDEEAWPEEEDDPEPDDEAE